MKVISSGAAALLALLSACGSAGPKSIAATSADRSAEIQTILERLDDRSLSTDQQLENYFEDAVILPPNETEIRGSEAIRDHLTEFGSTAEIVTRHEVVELTTLGDAIMAQGRVVGTASPHGDPNTYEFETKNLIVFEPNDVGALKISKVIYNSTPVADTLVASSDTAPEPAAADTPFSRFLGQWTLKEDQFQQVWDGETVESATIPNHFTACDIVNTSKSTLCVVDAGDLKGHIFWAYDDKDNTFRHLSHFGDTRLGVGKGNVSSSGDLNIKIAFSDEPEGTYRIYDYRWLNADTYEMMSRQYAQDGTATGNWYGGVFVRIGASD